MEQQTFVPRGGTTASVSHAVCLVNVPGVSEEAAEYGGPSHSGSMGPVGMPTFLSKCHRCQQKILMRGVSPGEMCSDRIILVAGSTYCGEQPHGSLAHGHNSGESCWRLGLGS